jgi:hypothetical protein
MLPATVCAKALIFLAGVSCAIAQADAPLDYEVKLTADYREASSPIKVLDKYASFRVGGVGVRVQANHQSLGSFYLGGGGGYSPNESASFVGATISGSADSTFYAGGYEYNYQISSDSQVFVTADYLVYDVEGDFVGSRAGVPVTANIKTDVTIGDINIGWKTAVSDTLSLGVGLGASQWEIVAVARGVLGDSIRATTDASAKGWDSSQFIRAEFIAFDVPLILKYQRAELNADNSVLLHALNLQITLPL